MPHTIMTDMVGLECVVTVRMVTTGIILAITTALWTKADKYDGKNADHRRIKKWIEEGDGLPDMARTEVVTEALKEVGFEIVEARDCALDACVPQSPRRSVGRRSSPCLGMSTTANAPTSRAYSTYDQQGNQGRFTSHS